MMYSSVRATVVDILGRGDTELVLELIYSPQSVSELSDLKISSLAPV